MNTLFAVMNGVVNRGREPMVFDWDRAAELIRDTKPEVAAAGLCNDWEWTGNVIWQDGHIVTDRYTYLESTWAVPELDMDGESIPCYRMKSDAPGWDYGTKWPESAVEILEAIVQEEAE